MHTVGVDPDSRTPGCITVLRPDGRKYRYGQGYSSVSRFDIYLPAEAFERVKLFGFIPLWSQRKFSRDQWCPKTEDEAVEAMVFATWLCDAINAHEAVQRARAQLAQDAVTSLSQ